MNEIKVILRDNKDSDEVFSANSLRISVGDESEDYRSYVADEIKICVTEDGALFFSKESAESFIYFYPDQLDHVAKALNIALKQRKPYRAPASAHNMRTRKVYTMKLTFTPLKQAPDVSMLNDEFGAYIGGTSTKRAAEIVRRVNAFDDLREMLDHLIGKTAAYRDSDTIYNADRLDWVLSDARALLASLE